MQGCFDIGLPSGKSLFQLQAERILKIQRLAAHLGTAPACADQQQQRSNGHCVPSSHPATLQGAHNNHAAALGDQVLLHWYIMTSAATHEATQRFFAEHSCFGLQPEQIFFFQQGTLPCLTEDGQPITGPDGQVRRRPTHATSCMHTFACSSRQPSNTAVKPSKTFCHQVCHVLHTPVIKHMHHTICNCHSLGEKTTAAGKWTLVAIRAVARTIPSGSSLHILQVATAPDGNGGVYKALVASGALNHMQQRGIEHLDCYCVDNALARVGDPAFIGACASSRAQLGAKVVAKLSPEERVGVFARCSPRHCHADLYSAS